ncbi:hypothetical protein CIHG_00617 [Coccidioides immitis H538.4]|uniref:Uncharacterized protein n=1 Tax=Coccidioides immitis H538.4 TaxID=396776 RepID=A0A0J8RFS5_COCIT|nr:hypothetical protein CIHG_00617 [Coccidioides immitis H538.4]
MSSKTEDKADNTSSATKEHMFLFKEYPRIKLGYRPTFPSIPVALKFLFVDLPRDPSDSIFVDMLDDNGSRPFGTASYLSSNRHKAQATFYTANDMRENYATSG